MAAMDYERNKLYFFPTPEKEAEGTKIGCIPIAITIIGVIILFAAMADGVGGAIVFGLLVMGAGIAWIAKIKSSNAKKKAEALEFNTKRIVVNDEEIDKICRDYVESNLKPMALKKLGLDESQVQEIEPIKFGGYYYKDDLKFSKRELKQGNDKRWRSSQYNEVMFFFSADQVYCYQLRFSLLDDGKQEKTDEYFYRDIVSVSTTSDSVAFEKNSISFEDFTLTTSGGTKMGATIFDIEDAERSVQGMKSLLRSKKQS